DRDRALGDELPRQALDGDRDDLLGAAIGLLTRLPLDLPDVPGRVVAGLILHLLDEGLLGLVARHAGGLLELLPDRIDEPLALRPAPLERTLFLPEPVLALALLGLALREHLDLPVDALLLLRHPLLERDQLAPMIPRLALRVRLGATDEVRRLALCLLADRVAFLARLLDDARRRGLRPALELREPTETAPGDEQPRAPPEPPPAQRDPAAP